MRSPQSHRNGETPRTPNHNHPLHHPHFHSTVSIQKLRRINTLILVLRFAAFCFTLASTIFMATNTRRGGSNSPNWHEFDSFRFVLAANAIVALYSFAEMGFSVWEILKGNTLLPETLQVWFDFGHDQVFAYMLLAADASGTNLARTMTGQTICTASNAFCIQSDISIALGFAGFLFLGCSTLFSGFRVVCFIINGSRFHV